MPRGLADSRCVSKIYATIKRSEWQAMPRKTRVALVKMIKALAAMTPRQIARLRVKRRKP